MPSAVDLQGHLLKLAGHCGSSQKHPATRWAYIITNIMLKYS